MRPLIVVGVLAAGMLALAGIGCLLLLVALVISASDQGDYPASFTSYPGSYNTYPAEYQTYPANHFQPPGRSPADNRPSDNQWNDRISHGTVDRSGEGNHVISVDGEVLNLP